MQSLPNALKLYLKLAIDRRQILARHLAMRIALGVLAAIVLIAGLALLNVALFLGLRPLLGDLWSVLTVALLHIASGGALAAYALLEPPSAELRALAEVEAAALAALDSEAEGRLASLAQAEQSIERIGSGLSLTANALPSIIGLFNRPAAPPAPASQPAAPKVAGDKS